MHRLTEWINRLRHLGGHRRFEGDLDDEIRFHLETRVADLENSGLSRSDALARARREFGSIALVREESRAPWRFRWLHDFAADLRYSFRAFRRSPAFTLTAVLSLALGIGGATAIYTALDAILWKPLPVADPNSLVGFSVSLDKDGPEADLPAAFVSRLRRSNIFSGLITSEADGLSFSYDGRAERIFGEIVSPDYFQVLGVRPIRGEGFTSGVRTGHWAPEAVLSYNFWKLRFGGDPDIIGRTIHLNTYPFTIVGVSPPLFSGLVRGTNYELRIPMLPDGQELAQIGIISGSPQRWLNTVARLQPGRTLSEAQGAADAQLQEFVRTTPIQEFKTAGLRHLQLSQGPRGFFTEEYVQPFHAPLYVLLVLVAIVLLIVCSNVANMLLARAATRAREFAIRTSIGAGRFRLIRQMLAESVLLAMLGGALGLALANWLTNVLFRFLPQGHINIAVDLHPDSRALIFTFTVSLLTGIIFGLTPSFEITRGNIAVTLKSDSAASAGAAGSARFRKLLVISQVAFSLTLLIAAAIFVRTLSELRPTEYRGNPEHVLLFTMKPQQELYSDERRRLLAGELIRRMSALPGVRSVALAENGALGSRTDSTTVEAPGYSPIRVAYDRVTPGFFDTIGIPRIAGRDFDMHDTPKSPSTVVVNQTLVRALFPNQNPVGRILWASLNSPKRAYEIVGVVGDTHYYDLHKAPGPFLWFSMMQTPPYMPTLHVRTTTSDTAGMIAAVRREFDLIDKGFPVFNIRTMAVRIEDSLAGERMVANLSGAFGILALLLAAVGLYGILAYSVSRRTREIGIRMALGARFGSVLWMIAREAFALVGAGSVAGAALAIAASRMLAHQLNGISAVDPTIVASCIFGMFFVAAAAVTIPAIRGCRVDPLRTLRHD